MKDLPRTLLFTSMLVAPMAMAQTASVHSAAGVLPPLPQGSQSSTPPHDAPMRPARPMTLAVREAATTPPPLPEGGRGAATPTAASPELPAYNTASPTPPSPASSAPATHLDFASALAEDVTIDVVDMRYGELLEKLNPAGWRMRTQNVEAATLDQRVDLTAQTTRGEVLRQLLARSGLTLKPFDKFDEPLLLITSR